MIPNSNIESSSQEFNPDDIRDGGDGTLIEVPTTDREDNPWIQIVVAPVETQETVAVNSVTILGNVGLVTIEIQLTASSTYSTLQASVDATQTISFDSTDVYAIRVTLLQPILNNDGTRPDMYQLTMSILGCFEMGKLKQFQ